MENLCINPQKLYKGCLLAAIVHAVTVGCYPELNYEHSWDTLNYCMNNSEGCRATITFHPDCIIAVFQDIQGQTVNPLRHYHDYFSGAPKSILETAQAEALQYVLEDIHGKTEPVITAAFWGTWTQLYANQTWPEILENGGHIIERQLLDYSEAMDSWNAYYGLNKKQIKLINSLYQRKLECDKKPLFLNKQEISCLFGDIDECRESLNELNICF